MVRRLLIALVFGLFPLLAGAAASAGPPAALLADRIEIDAAGCLIASGNVEVIYQGRRLRAARIIYDRTAGSLALDGPVRLDDPGGSVILAEGARLSDDLAEGLMLGARMILDSRLQIAARALGRSGGRFTTLTRARASSCRVCSAEDTPLWEIRARRVVHDEVAQLVYFEGAQLRFGGVPVLWLPRLRMPGPGLDRAPGWVRPRPLSTSVLGLGVEASYFLPLGPSRDLTFTPMIASQGAGWLAMRYRQAFRHGSLSFSGAVGSDRSHDGLRGHGTLSGRFDLGRRFVLSIDAAAASDRSVLADWGVSDRDRIDSRAEIARTGRTTDFRARVVHERSLRPTVFGTARATVLGDVAWRRRDEVPWLGGTGTLGLSLSGNRLGTAPAPGAVRAAARTTLAAGWRGERILAGGVVAALQADLAADLHRIEPEAAGAYSARTVTPTAALSLRWPLIRARGGVVEIIEPVAQIVVGRLHDPAAVPNGDSLSPELDEGNLFALSRFPGMDRREGGARLNLGLGYRRIDPDGRRLALLAGRVLRPRDEGQFEPGTGLAGKASAWLAALHFDDGGGASLGARLLFDPAGGISRGDLRAAIERPGYSFATALVRDEGVPASGDPLRQAPVADILAEGSMGLGRGWTGSLASRFDAAAGEPVSAGLGLGFENECLLVDLSLSRRFASSTTLEASTNFGLSVELIGFGSSGGARRAAQCDG
jgi:LPS-assembly protein